MKRPDAFEPLDSEAALRSARAASRERPVVLFKHSLTCPVSASANREMAGMTESDDPPIYRLVVQHARPLSNRIAQDYDIRHESPQVIVLRDEQPVFHASHGRVRAAAVREAAREAMDDEAVGDVDA